MYLNALSLPYHYNDTEWLPKYHVMGPPQTDIYRFLCSHKSFKYSNFKVAVNDSLITPFHEEHSKKGNFYIQLHLMLIQMIHS